MPRRWDCGCGTSSGASSRPRLESPGPGARAGPRRSRGTPANRYPRARSSPGCASGAERTQRRSGPARPSACFFHPRVCPHGHPSLARALRASSPHSISGALPQLDSRVNCLLFSAMVTSLPVTYGLIGVSIKPGQTLHGTTDFLLCKAACAAWTGRVPADGVVREGRSVVVAYDSHVKATRAPKKGGLWK